MCDIYKSVTLWSCPNFLGARIPLPTNLNLHVWENETRDYFDAEVVQFLRFGWPVSYRGPVPTLNRDNHASANNFHEHVKNLLTKKFCWAQC
jgi:hypothetical protein